MRQLNSIRLDFFQLKSEPDHSDHSYIELARIFVPLLSSNTNRKIHILGNACTQGLQLLLQQQQPQQHKQHYSRNIV